MKTCMIHGTSDTSDTSKSRACTGLAGVLLSASLCLSLLLAGCAGQNAYHDGTELVAQGQSEAGLVRFQEALAGEPDNPQYRQMYMNTRDRLIQADLAQADTEFAANQVPAAQQTLQKILALDPRNDRARAGLAEIEVRTRHQAMLASAATELAQDRFEEARDMARKVLSERADNAEAKELKQTAEQKLAARAAATTLAQAYRQPVSIEFRDASLKVMFEILARYSGLNFVFDKDVKVDTKVSVYLKNSTVEAALYYLLVTNQLEQEVMDNNTILIYPSSAAKQKEYQEMMVKTFYLTSADAKLVANTLKTILKTRDLVIDEKLNALIVRDTPEAIRLAEKLIRVQDVAEPEVLLDVEVLEVTHSRLQDLGIAWPTSVTLTPMSITGGTSVTLADITRANHSTTSVTGVAASINASQTDGDTSILANPRIRVRNKEKAKVLIGNKVPVITTTISSGVGGFASESVSYIDVGLTLNVEPVIYLNNEVAIRISLEVSTVANQITTKSGTIAYQIGTRQASTLLQLKDGENELLAGLIDNEERNTANKVPGLGSMPILGKLFGSDSSNGSKTEIVLSITPHLIRNIQPPEVSSSEFMSGTDSSFRKRPVTTIRVPASALKGQGGAAVVLTAPVPAAALPSSIIPGHVMTAPDQPGGRNPVTLFQASPDQPSLPGSAPPPAVTGIPVIPVTAMPDAGTPAR